MIITGPVTVATNGAESPAKPASMRRAFPNEASITAHVAIGTTAQ